MIPRDNRGFSTSNYSGYLAVLLSFIFQHIRVLSMYLRSDVAYIWVIAL